MSDATSTCRPSLLLAVFFIAVSFAGFGCNLSDPITSLPTDGCEDDSDCDDNGTCEIDNGVGTCDCDPGYTDDDCSDCEDGYEEQDDGSCTPSVSMTNNNTTNTSNNNTSNNMMCEEGEVMLDGMCVVDGCAANPCGDGTCTVTGDDAWECECPNGTTGIECPSCEAGCVNGTCNVDGVCECERGWSGMSCSMCAPGFEGANCDTCAANAFGENCDTCATISEAQPWWDDAYQMRQALIVYNPGTATQAAADGVVVPYEFNHSVLVSNMTADIRGLDLRVVEAPDNERDRILGFDSDWNRTDTEVWFSTATALNPGQFSVYYLYLNNDMPAPVRNDATMILRQDRGWYSGPNGPLYSPMPRSGGQYSIQVRQKDPMTMQVYFHDSGDDPNAFAEVRFFDINVGQVVQSVSYGASLGSSSNPADETDEFTMLPNTMRMDITVNPGTEGGAIYLGAVLADMGSGSLFIQPTATRPTPPMTSIPRLVACTAETAP